VETLDAFFSSVRELVGNSFIFLKPDPIRKKNFDSLHWRLQQLNNFNIQLVGQLL
jgi:hypothetical protein